MCKIKITVMNLLMPESDLYSESYTLENTKNK